MHWYKELNEPTFVCVCVWGGGGTGTWERLCHMTFTCLFVTVNGEKRICCPRIYSAYIEGQPHSW